MVEKKIAYLCIGLIFLYLSPLYAQFFIGDSTQNIGNSTIEGGFRQEFNTYLWHINTGLDKTISPRLNFSFFENFRTSMLRLATEADRWKDDQNLGIKIRYTLSTKVLLHTQATSIIFLDKQSGFNNDFQTHSGNVGFVYTPIPQIRSNFLIGPKWDSRFDLNDKGLTYGLDLKADQLSMADYENNFEFSLGEDRYNQRINSNMLAAYRVNKNFSSDASDSLFVFLNNRRRDNYVSNVGDIESQRENIKGFRNRLYYKVSQSTNFNINSLVELKNVELLQYGETSNDRRRKRNDQRISNDASLTLKKKKTQASFNVSHWIQEQRYDIDVSESDKPFSSRTAFVTPDNSSSRIIMYADLRSKIGKGDSLTLYISTSKFQYDTPDTNNFDDRDELRINTRASYLHRFSSELSLELQASVNLYHMVYIFGERSADNNWNRIFYLRPIIFYQPFKKVTFNQSFEVLSNYVDYDFDDVVVSTKSFVFRKFAMTDSLHWQVLPRTFLLVDYRLQLEENGQLSWERWSEKILVTRQKHWFHIYWKYVISEYFNLVPGYTFYSRDEWRHNNDPLGNEVVEKIGTYKSHGPILRFLYFPSQNLRLFVDATRYKVSATGQDNSYVNNIEMGLKWIF